MSKQIHIKATHGVVDPITAPNRGSIEFQTGKQAADKLIAELNGRFGQALNDRLTVVVPFESEDAAEAFKTFLTNLELSKMVGEELKEQAS